MSAPNTAKNVNRGIPALSAVAVHSDVSSTSVSPTSKKTARTPLGIGALLPALEAVVRGVLVRLAQRRDVERRLDEVVDRVAVLQCRLTNVDRLRCALAKDVDTE